MSYDQEGRQYGDRGYSDREFRGGRESRERDEERARDEVYSQRVPAGKRTYFFDVKTTRSGEDFFVTITESKRIDENRYEKHKIFLYKEDFGKFVQAMHDVIRHIKEERLPGYDFRGLPPLESYEYSEEEDYDEGGEEPPEYPEEPPEDRPRGRY